MWPFDNDYGKLTPLSSRRLQRYEVLALASCYWPAEEVENAVNVADIESAFWTAARNTTGEDSRGIWQINCNQFAHPELAKYNLFDPQINAYFAHQIWQSGGWHHWYNAAKALGLI